MARPVDEYGDPLLVLERKQRDEKSCRVCIYNLRQEQKCLTGQSQYPSNGQDCRRWKHRDQ